MNWRGLFALGWILAVLVTLGGIAWLTQNPESEIVEKAQDWPWIGPWAGRFRQAYLPAQKSPLDPASAEVTGAEVEVIELSPVEAFATSFVWVQPGAKLHAAPDKQSPVLQTVTSIRNLAILEQRGDWYRVHPSPLDRFHAWVWLENYQHPEPDVLNQPDPVLPLPATPPTSETIALARRWMEDGGGQRSCGPYSLFSDARDTAFFNLCPRVTQNVEEVYRQRYGVEPVSPPAEAIFLFLQESSYGEFREIMQVPVEVNTAHASPAKGHLAFYQGTRSTPDMLGTLVHELTHLLNRRALGPALPPWLSEGIADDMADSRMDADGSLHPGELGGETQIRGQKIVRRGGVAAVLELQGLFRDNELPSLAALIEMDRDQFYEPDSIQLHYALSSFWIRFLLSGFDTDLTSGLRAFLLDLSSGTPITTELLLERLGTDWQDLEEAFHTWMYLQFLQPPNETRDDSA